MATYDVAVGHDQAVAGHQTPSILALEGRLDLSTVNDGGGLAQNDVAQVIAVPANTWIVGVFYEVSVAGDNGPFDIGDGADADGWIDGLDASATGTGYSGPLALVEGAPNTVDGYASGKFYADADTIDITQAGANTVTTGVIKAIALAAAFVPAT